MTLLHMPLIVSLADKSCIWSLSKWKLENDIRYSGPFFTCSYFYWPCLMLRFYQFCLCSIVHPTFVGSSLSPALGNKSHGAGSRVWHCCLLDLAQASGRPSGVCTHWGGSVGTRPTVMSSMAQSLGLSQAFSATEDPKVAQLAVLDTDSPWDLSESTLGREKDIAKVKVLKAIVGAHQKGNRPK